MTPEQRAEIHAHFEKLGLECIEDNQITAEDIESLRNHKVPSGPEVPCFMACIMKKIGLVSSNSQLLLMIASNKLFIIFIDTNFPNFAFEM